ncbi:MAG: FkbM family methyltransferase, partial [Planctomycetes bacterium]|nr:FkbM family methyltransferase [Planctomycetota bacterium]
PENRYLRKLYNNRLSQESETLNLPSGQEIKHIQPFEAYCEYKDLFIQGIYHFTSEKKNPVIVDGGAYVGFSILYFKHLYPEAQITAFECDPELFHKCQENLKTNALEDVKLINAALASKNGERTFFRSGDDGGALKPSDDHELNDDDFKVLACKLSDYLNNEVDFLKLNIEGAEFEVLAEAEEKLENVKELVIEFHSFAGQEQRLQELLTILSRKGFRYLLNHFDYESNLAVKPPFHLDQNSTYILLLYAKNFNKIGKN